MFNNDRDIGDYRFNLRDNGCWWGDSYCWCFSLSSRPNSLFDKVTILKATTQQKTAN